MTDIIIVGSGPGGLAAATIAAAAGLHVHVIEASDTLGGGLRSYHPEPGVTFDECSSTHPLAAASPFFTAFDLAAHGVELRHPQVPYSHGITPELAVAAHRSTHETARDLAEISGPRTAAAWQALFGPLTEHSHAFAAAGLSDLRGAAMRPTAALVRNLAPSAPSILGALPHIAKDTAAASLLGAACVHAKTMPHTPAALGVGVFLATLAQSSGWPIPVGGSGTIAAALIDYVVARGGTFQTGSRITSLVDLPPATAYLFDTSPTDFAAIAGDALPARTRRAYGRYRYGSGVAKVDFVLHEPIPWVADAHRRAGTVHLGGRWPELAAAERSAATGQMPTAPVTFVGQPHLVDDTRTPDSRVTAWAYAHVPAGSSVDPQGVVTEQIERYAPGFRDTVQAAFTTTARQWPGINANYPDGDIGCGQTDLRQLIARPMLRANPYSTGVAGMYLCSAAVPPGPGVHGMGGVHAMGHVLRAHFDTDAPVLSHLR